MKNTLAFLFLLLSIVVFGQTETTGKINTVIMSKYELGYVLHKPANTKEKKPLIVFISGDGEKGTDLEKVKVHGPLKYLKTHQLDAYVLAPQCKEDENWDIESIYQLILKIQKENKIDSDRIYVTGLSSGGWASWNLAFAHPDLFAANVPVAGFVDLIQLEHACEIANIPTRIFHGLLDDVVNVNYAITIYKELKKCNAKDVKLTIFDDANHDSWTKVYDNQEIYDWMFQQKKTNTNK
ncbi:prolyl oligopeptidase family serine peptidase [Flavobacterium johnsoniae]|jgi:predicted peptidase|uniref:Candidate esterase Carbohydrate esterase family 1 n=1 Tax=Flavobacterium johnsoniae (strain ATCC 17061 / DSM 2064 / JCM 8514 / BCRC 14874 / CCUG 350202 / NBRC 14942 / NCIMB 11054 / UW101) TaxID=376686 RepID=A5FE33_FLAJ1|nr:prolyl oligopeptidase family serine peptidase [Flavobacterium johnsoniae]ABQ06536.1 Candidate esterase; Carbohydrate esterase family 1 [Flavobacterium johnsoniae UW101]OXE99775.1 phospholipase [Flavobacterium johnsoniae UW101]WQG82288.1 prolyl oligopeptidase family serine peptidase [Flavobacterium johnsoniae UW101]SHK78725.1 Phospholipase/Carboxylesterase [Flavobacterium johnsoniae]